MKLNCVVTTNKKGQIEEINKKVLVRFLTERLIHKVEQGLEFSEEESYMNRKENEDGFTYYYRIESCIEEAIANNDLFFESYENEALNEDETMLTVTDISVLESDKIIKGLKEQGELK